MDYVPSHRTSPITPAAFSSKIPSTFSCMKIRSLFRGIRSSITRTRELFQYFDTLQFIFGPLADIRQRTAKRSTGFGHAVCVFEFFEGLAKAGAGSLAELKTSLVDLQSFYSGFERGYGDSKLRRRSSLACHLAPAAHQLSLNDVPFLIGQLIRQRG